MALFYNSIFFAENFVNKCGPAGGIDVEMFLKKVFKLFKTVII